MPRYAVKIEYNGAPFVGWQAQTDLPSVQSALETAIKNATGQELRVTAAGRTDTGVHALGQVASFDLEKVWEPFRLSEALNYHLKPLPVAITATSEVGADFSARFDAQERFYTYRVLSRRAPAVLDQGWVWQVIHSLDVVAMQEAANHLIGKHDFTTFRSVQCQALSPIKTMNEITIESETHSQGMLIKFHLRAQSFLHNQVRSIVGSLVHVGRNKWRPDDMRIALEAADRSACGQVAPPQGLFLMDVRYPTDIFATATSRTTN